MRERDVVRIRHKKKSLMKTASSPQDPIFGPGEKVVKRTYNSSRRLWEGGEQIWVQLGRNPIATGSCRSIHRIRVGDDGKEWIAKFINNAAASKIRPPRPASTLAFEDCLSQITARELADRFNERDPPQKISFQNCYVVEFIERQGRPAAIIEEYMVGGLCKHNNRVGKVLSSRILPQAFSHFTAQCNDGKLIVTNIQGVDNKFTGPQVHTHNGDGFGPSNFGVNGIRSFFRGHTCNVICAMMNLPRLDKGIVIPQWTQREKEALMKQFGIPIPVYKSSTPVPPHHIQAATPSPGSTADSSTLKRAITPEVLQSIPKSDASTSPMAGQPKTRSRSLEPPNRKNGGKQQGTDTSPPPQKTLAHVQKSTAVQSEVQMLRQQLEERKSKLTRQIEEHKHTAEARESQLRALRQSLAKEKQQITEQLRNTIPAQESNSSSNSSINNNNNNSSNSGSNVKADVKVDGKGATRLSMSPTNIIRSSSPPLASTSAASTPSPVPQHRSHSPSTDSEEIRLLREQIRTLSSQLSLVNEEVELLRQKDMQRETEAVTIADLMEQLSVANKQVDTLKHQIRHKGSEYEVFTKKLLELQEKYEKQRVDAEIQLNASVDRSDSLLQQLQSAEQLLVAAQYKEEINNERIGDLEKQIDVLSTTSEQANALKKALTEIAQLNEEMKVSERARMEAGEEISSIKTQLVQVNKLMSNLSHESNQREQALQEATALSEKYLQQINEQNEMIVELRHASSSRGIQSNMQQKEEWSQLIEKMRKEHRNQIAVLQHDHAAELAQAQSRINELKEENAEKARELQSLSHSISAIGSEEANLTKQLVESQQFGSEVAKLLERTSEEAEKIQRKYQEQLELNEKLLRQLKEGDDPTLNKSNVGDLKEQIAKLQLSLQSANVRNDAMTTKYSKTLENYETAQKFQRQLEQQIDSLTKESALMKAQIADTRRQLEKKEIDYAELMTVRSQIEAQHQRDLSEFRRKVTALEETIRSKENLIRKMELENDGLRSDVKRMQTSLHSHRSTDLSESQQTNSLRWEIERQRVDMTSEIEAKERDIENLRAQIFVLTKEKHNEHSAVLAAKEETDKLKMEIAKMRDDRQWAEREVQSYGQPLRSGSQLQWSYNATIPQLTISSQALSAANAATTIGPGISALVPAISRTRRQMTSPASSMRSSLSSSPVDSDFERLDDETLNLMMQRLEEETTRDLRAGKGVNALREEQIVRVQQEIMRRKDSNGSLTKDHNDVETLSTIYMAGHHTNLD